MVGRALRRPAQMLSCSRECCLHENPADWIYRPAGKRLGASLQGEEVAPLTHREIEVSDPASVRRAFERYRPEVVINTAAYHRVDDCEREIEKAFHVNAFAVCDLALACREYHAVLVHFSTDYVFGGDQEEPYLEIDLPRPLCPFGKPA